MRPNTKYKQCVMIGIIFYSITVFTGCDSPVDNTDDDSTIHWTVENSPYIVEDNLVIEKGTKLMIEPGVTVAFKTARGLIIRGELSAIGTEKDSIIFTFSPDTSFVGFKEYWRGFKFDSCGTNTKLEYCFFKGYLSDEFAIICDNSSPTFKHCIFPSFTPHIETGGGIILCIHNSFPSIEYSRLSMGGFKTACVACANPSELINLDQSNPKLIQNDFYISNDGYAVVAGGFLDGNYINIWTGGGTSEIDTSLGNPVDKIGDGIFSTCSRSCINVDGVKNPLNEPNFPVAGF